MRLADAPRFLSPDTIIAEVARLSYRPGWALSVFVDPFEGPVLRVVATAANSYTPGSDPVELRINSRIPWMSTVEQLRLWVLWRLNLVESHECREFFRVDGRVLFDPHDPLEPG